MMTDERLEELEGLMCRCGAGLGVDIWNGMSELISELRSLHREKTESPPKPRKTTVQLLRMLARWNYMCVNPILRDLSEDNIKELARRIDKEAE